MTNFFCRLEPSSDRMNRTIGAKQFYFVCFSSNLIGWSMKTKAEDERPYYSRCEPGLSVPLLWSHAILKQKNRICWTFTFFYGFVNHWIKKKLKKNVWGMFEIYSGSLQIERNFTWDQKNNLVFKNQFRQ